jgi:hypothetical protein
MCTHAHPAVSGFFLALFEKNCFWPHAGSAGKLAGRKFLTSID